jgi:hypothetical protein
MNGVNCPRNYCQISDSSFHCDASKCLSPLLRSPHPSLPGGDGQRLSKDVRSSFASDSFGTIQRKNKKFLRILCDFAPVEQDDVSAEKMPTGQPRGLPALKDWSLDGKTEIERWLSCFTKIWGGWII